MNDKLLKELVIFLQDGYYIKIGDFSKEIDWAEKYVCKPILKMICRHIGHDIESDQCGKPEHDFCVICQETFPGQAPHRISK